MESHPLVRVEVHQCHCEIQMQVIPILWSVALLRPRSCTKSLFRFVFAVVVGEAAPCDPV
jgi:hypothetical protein